MWGSSISYLIMARPGALLILTVLACVTLLAQEAVVRRDTQFPVELSDTIKSRSAKVGDKVKFRLNGAVLIGNNIVVPDGSKLTGTIEAVQNDSTGEPHSLLSIRVGWLEWKKGSARLNAVVLSVEPTPAENMVITRRRRWPPLLPPSFLEGIRIKSHVRRDAYTDFLSDKKDFVLRSGTTFVLRHIDPTRDPAMMGNDSIIDIEPH
jgi:hypothetical protein